MFLRQTCLLTDNSFKLDYTFLRLINYTSPPEVSILLQEAIERVILLEGSCLTLVFSYRLTYLLLSSHNVGFDI